MKVKLKEICEVQLGYAFRSRMEQTASGNLAVIQMKDLSANKTVDTSNLSRIHFDGMKSHHFVKKGDLVFRSRGSDTSTAIVVDEIPDCVVAAPLYILRVKDGEQVHPSYLNWIISQTRTQSFLRSRMAGSNQMMVSRQVLENISTPLPTFQKQQQIAEINELSEHEGKLMSAISQKKLAMVNTLLQDYAEGDA